jgi:NAD(P)-dependent dehydrogenase (short-subunit alcohol dehydrogenase family)
VTPEFEMTKTLLITGASGIAAATARLAAGRGWRVFVVGKVESECKALAEELASLDYAIADVSNYQAVQKAVAACVAKHGAIDAVFNVAGGSGRSLGDGPLHECSPEAWRGMMDVHAAGTFYVCREVIGQWLGASRKGAIVNTGSVLARYPERDFFATHAYAASKGAIESMSLAAAAYYAPHGIRVNVIAPSLVRTPMSVRARSNEKILSFIAHKQPLKGDLVEAEEIARIALFLLSEDSVPITGEVIRADAGWAVTG